MANGVDMIKDGTPYLVVGTGSGLSLQPEFVLQIAGVIVTFIGIILAYLRWREAKRSNDIEERRLEHDIGKDSNGKKKKANINTNG